MRNDKFGIVGGMFLGKSIKRAGLASQIDAGGGARPTQEYTTQTRNLLQTNCQQPHASAAKQESSKKVKPKGFFGYEMS